MDTLKCVKHAEIPALTNCSAPYYAQHRMRSVLFLHAAVEGVTSALPKSQVNMSLSLT